VGVDTKTAEVEDTVVEVVVEVVGDMTDISFSNLVVQPSI